MNDSLINHPVVIGIFVAVVGALLLYDLGIFNKQEKEISHKKAITMSIIWISLSMLFSLVVWKTMSFQKFSEYQTAFWIEQALSVDNLFVFILVFNYFNVPKLHQHKVLFWGILGAIVMRAIFIFLGVALIEKTYLSTFYIGNIPVRINVVLSVFGIFLIYAGIKSWFVVDDDDGEKDFNKSPGSKFVHKFFTVSKNFDEGKFFTTQNGLKLATPLLVVLSIIEFTDLIFAVDSIPAIFAVSNDPFILYTSNIFAILGLRSMYFVLANFIDLFDKLKYGLAIILAFIGLKMVMSPVLHISSPISLAIVGGVLVLSVIASLILKEKK